MAVIHRRTFLRHNAGLAAAFFAGGQLRSDDTTKSPMERINVAVIGVAGRGASNLAGVQGENIVALCDVDENRAKEARNKFPKAAYFQDFRKMLDMKGIDAVVISTPDHMHAIPAVAAMQLGKHVYCEKPLAHSVHEVRVMRDMAAKQKLVTQMGTQIHAGDNYRRVVELIQADAIGPVRRVHVWCNRRPDPGYLAKESTPAPSGLDYDLWLGPAPYRPYHESHLHFNWRWWWDFGGGVMADMACHFMDLPHWALNLRSPLTVEGRGEVLHKGDNPVPDLEQVEYHYAERGSMPPVHLTWYHGTAGPDLQGKTLFPKYTSGVLFEGEKGQLISDYNKHALLPEEKFKDFQRPVQSIPKSVGHHREWLDAIRGNKITTCNFDYSGALAETVLLGNVAYRSGKKIAWNPETATITNSPDAAAYLQREYRKGWKLL